MFRVTTGNANVADNNHAITILFILLFSTLSEQLYMRVFKYTLYYSYSREIIVNKEQ